MKYKSFAAALDEYLTLYLGRDRRCTASTIKNYTSTLTRFINERPTLDEANVTEFLRGIEHTPSRNTALTRLKGFAKFLHISLSNVPRAAEIVKDPDALNSRQIAALCREAFAIGPATGNAVTLLSQTGLRIHEFYKLSPEHLRIDEEYHSLKVLGKGQKIRSVPLNKQALAAYQAIKWPFPVPLKRFRLYLEQAGQSAGVPGVHPHLLRASCASIMLNERGIDSVVVAKIFGWAKVDTMARHYYMPAMAKLQEAVNQ